MKTSKSRILDRLFNQNGRLQKHAPLLMLLLITWLLAAIIPLASGAFWPVAAADQAWHQHALHFTTDKISSLPIQGGEWILQPWLSSLTMLASWHLGSITGLSILNIVLSVLTAFQLYRLADRNLSSKNHAQKHIAVLTSLASLLLLMPLTLRTEEFAILIGVSLLLELGKQRAYWTAPLLICLWTQVHGSFFMGILACVFAALGMYRNSFDWKIWQRTSLIFGSILASFANPFGFGLWQYVYHVSTLKGISSLTPIWQPLNVFSFRGILLVGILLFLGSRLKRKTWKTDIWRMVPIFMLAIGSFMALRNISWFALFVLPELAFSMPYLRLPKFSNLISIALIAPLIMAVFFLFPGTKYQRQLALFAQPSDKLVAFVQDKSISAQDKPVFASLEWADYIYLKTGKPVYMDARLERYSSQDRQNYLRMISQGCQGQCLYKIFALHKKTALPLIRDLERASQTRCTHTKDKYGTVYSCSNN